MKVVDEIFAAVNLKKEDHEEIYKRCEEIMMETEAELSVIYGLSRKRLEAYESQKQSLIEELRAHFGTAA